MSEQLARIIPFLIPDTEKPQGSRSADLPAVDWENFHAVAEVLAEVHEEMEAQDEEWGEQNHPLITTSWLGIPNNVASDRAFFAEKAESYKQSNDDCAKSGDLDWAGILLEEVYEALAEDDADKAVVELIQVAAVAVQAALSIRRNGLGDEGVLSEAA